MTAAVLADRIALITGASRGLGAAVARAFAAAGAHVILVARTTGGLEEVDDHIRAAGGTATLVPMDLVEFDAIDRLGAMLYERFGRLDVLVGNAGVLGGLGPVGHLAPKLWQEVIDLNLTANWRLIRSMDPLLRLSPSGRAIFVTDSAARKTKAYWGPYAAAKAALECLVLSYAAELANTSAIKVNLIDPGVVATDLRATAFPGDPPGTAIPPDDVASGFIPLATDTCERHGDLIRLG